MKRDLTLEYTSSDESDYEENSDTEEMELKAYEVKALPWQRSTLTNLKNKLDGIYVKSLSKRSRELLVPRKRGELISNRELPQNIVPWAARSTSTPLAKKKSITE